ncbi:hypothetical protein IP78_13620 [Brevundimonas sp. AAP58]|uniref:antibiotic biosynthesis monooxygenase family protein n=1 Tax=Brevundimonas sp. AAP58 TaxID=1523422 RepID=UPI0006CD354B|nr:antibiotic biosynthesis monooxygenase family protein [Brevundimonas sp. AAP58]KPF75596.1 hypothetical protein IP78_13620 [Brevundimonas sp. AAP58]
MRLVIFAMMLGLGIVTSSVARAQEVILINVFEVPEGQVEETIEAWEVARSFLSQQPGYVSTTLHRSITPDARFELINVAVWSSPEAFRSASERMVSEAIMPPVAGLRFSPALYTVVRQDPSSGPDQP